ncbi:class I adenylate-forming enzyme family protein [Neobacillus citreus]|uniref:AMP-binding protein n=1 Tax=Neobacillus citreus TaxID=2833578 RepID=A0A942YDB9_9BACI|nr:AMP-binding protein [Neobacillus citreus]MCH6264357.1 AMP-binding protein [Neobacillus citreus]
MQDWIVHKVLANAVDRFPNKPFLIYEDQRITYKELDDVTDVLASALLQEGFERGDKMAILALNQLEWLYTYFAAAKIGVGVVALNVRYRDSELEYMLNNSKAKGIVSISGHQGFNFAQFFEKFQDKVPSVEKYIFIGYGFEGSLSFEEWLARPLDRGRLEAAKQAVLEEDTAVVIYTSGTTGKPKGTMITNRSILASAKAQADHLSLGAGDCTVGSLPLNHVGGITCAVHALLVSYGSIVLVPEFIPEKVLQVIHHVKPTVFGGVPTMYHMLLNHKHINQYDLSSIKVCIAGGSNVDPTQCEMIETKFPNAKIINLYGLSETSGACIMTRLTDSLEKVQQSIGVPIGDFSLMIVDAEQKELASGEVGEVAVKGDCRAKGYFELEEETRLAFSEDGWLYTGDMGYLDHEGYVILKGRKKEMYIQGGYNVYPVEVENILMSHPKIGFAAGIGVPDSFLGEVGRYYIIPKEGATMTEEEVKSFCQQHLADYKVPRQVVFVSQLPQTPAGKIQKSALKEQYLKQLQ